MSKDKSLLPTSPRWIQKCMRRLQMWPNKKMGQNFLLDNDALRQIVEQAQLTPKDTVLEIGPGLGHLTQYILQKKCDLWAVELDQKLAKFVSQKFAQWPKFHILNADILASKRRIAPDVLEKVQTGNTSFKLLSNLPYNIATQVIMSFLELLPPPASIIVTVQREVAQRLVAQPGSRDYGYLSVYAQMYSSPEIVAQLPMRSFYPPPKVESTVVKMIPRPFPSDVADVKTLTNLVKASFQLRRKKLSNALRHALGRPDTDVLKTLLQESGIDPERRAETLTLKEFTTLANTFYRHGLADG